MPVAPPPKGQAAWDGISLAKALGVSKTSVYAVLRKEGVQLVARSLCVSADPEFAAKAGEHRGPLSAASRAGAGDLGGREAEHPGASRTDGIRAHVERQDGAGLKSTYRRGTLTLFAAPERRHRRSEQENHRDQG